MKVLEIKGFMFFARDYEGDHEVVRWGIGEKGSHRRSELNILTTVIDGFKLWRRVDSMGIDAIVCQSFGMAYGNRKGGKWVWLRHFLKYFYERMLIWMVLSLCKKSSKPLAVIDISDDISINPINRKLLDQATLYFKRELPLDGYHAFEGMRRKWLRRATTMDRATERWREWLEKLRPLPLGCAQVEPGVDLVKTWPEKKWDVFYIGDDDLKPRRKGLIDALKALEKSGCRVRIPSGPLPLEEYLEELSYAKLAVSPPGLGWDCHRTYEAAMVGTVPVTSYPAINRYKPLLNGVHCLYYDHETSLSEQLMMMLDQGSELQKIAIESSKHVRSHHTHEALFDYVICALTGHSNSRESLTTSIQTSNI